MVLAATISRVTAECGGTVAVVAVHLPTGRRIDREADRSFPSASVIKVPILAALHAEVEAGRLAYLAGRMQKRRYADPSSPLAGLI